MQPFSRACSWVCMRTCFAFTLEWSSYCSTLQSVEMAPYLGAQYYSTTTTYTTTRARSSILHPSVEAPPPPPPPRQPDTKVANPGGPKLTPKEPRFSFRCSLWSRPTLLYTTRLPFWVRTKIFTINDQSHIISEPFEESAQHSS